MEKWNIRPARGEDAQAMLDYLQIIGGETDCLTFGREGLPVTAEQEQRFLACAQSDPHTVLLLAEENGTIVASAGMTRAGRARLQHRAQIDVSVRKSHWNRGLATHLLTELLAIGRRAGVTAFCLEVLEDNAPAIHLYEKLGFRRVGRWERFFCMPDGRFRAALLMELCT